ncbi:integrase catalytic domain-containing protein [Trichonephila clavipes]|nr:integrase catalytic domain-containing protein [Trichonephila clavipes]
MLSARHPEEHVKRSSETNGVDLASPLLLRNPDKVWIAFLTCVVFLAINFELFSDISTQSFLLALRRFVSRRGRVKTIDSGNITNFVRLNNELQNIDWSAIIAHTDLKNNWCLNPPTTTWWGRLLERLVRMLKELLRRNLGKASL